ncbi:rCG44023 [Rattus norvegicus]|uniref:RCG44023 n=1 Tax=Rattus norvegicus TaxID=10116 RepID=A6J7E3_RAT|nr:rCG44023 [Rattus norvegicus]
MCGQRTVGLRGAALEQKWCRGLSKPLKSHPEICTVGLLSSLPQAYMYWCM